MRYNVFIDLSVNLWMCIICVCVWMVGCLDFELCGLSGTHIPFGCGGVRDVDENVGMDMGVEV